LAFVLEIALVGDDNDGERVLVLDSEDLLVERRNFFKRVARGDRIDEQEALSGAHVLLTHCAVYVKNLLIGLSEMVLCVRSQSRQPGRGRLDGPVFFLAGRIEHVKKRDLVVDHALLAIRVFDGLTGGTSVRACRGLERIDNGQWAMESGGGRWMD
jgi:hypothetical protein